MKKILLAIVILLSFSFAYLDKYLYSEEQVTVSQTVVFTETVDGYPTYYAIKPISGNIYISLKGEDTTPNAMDTITEGSLYSPDLKFKIGNTIKMLSTDNGTATVYLLRYIN